MTHKQAGCCVVTIQAAATPRFRNGVIITCYKLC